MHANSFFTKLAATLLAGFLLSLPGYAEEAPEENPPTNEAHEETAPDPTQSVEATEAATVEPKTDYVPENTKETGKASKTAKTAKGAKAVEVAKSETAQEPKNLRDQGIFDRIKTLVKRLDAQQRKGFEFPSKMVEAAIRSEFMRRTEGAEGPSWLKKRTRESDKEVALDNLEMLLAYAEKLSWSHPGKSKDAKEAVNAVLEVKLLAAKAVVDRYNVRNTNGRRLASFSGFAPAKGLSGIGKIEAARRGVLTGGQVAGEDFQPITGKKFEDYAKKYRSTLVASVMEYEKLAALVAGAQAPKEMAAPAKKTSKKNKKSKKSEE